MKLSKLFFALSLTCLAWPAASNSQTQTNPAGTVGYTTSKAASPSPCGTPAIYIQYTGWYFKDSNQQTHTFAGTSTACTPLKYTTHYTGFTAVSSDGGYSITTSGPTGVVTIAGVQGYINPKYIVLGVTYAPPGPQSSVTYTSSVGLGISNSISTSRSTGTTFTVSISDTVGIGGWKQGTKVSDSNSATQTTKSTNTVTLNWSISDTVKSSGTPTPVVGGSYDSPVAHDYDIIYVWLNPVVVLTLSPQNIVWNGYGYDEGDQNGMDIVGIPLGYLNGDFGPLPADLLSSTNRAWAASQTYAAGQSAALNSVDFANIATYDPFSASGYGQSQIGSDPPNPTTADNRFTLTNCNSQNSVPFLQAPPSQAPGGYTCTLNYSSISTKAQSLTTSSTNTFSVDRSYSGSIFSNDLTLDFMYANTVTTQTEVDSSISTSISTSSVANITGLSCNNVTPDVGPCVPPYDGPTQFDIYQDNLFGTFMFAPVHYYN